MEQQQKSTGGETGPSGSSKTPRLQPLRGLQECGKQPVRAWRARVVCARGALACYIFEDGGAERACATAGGSAGRQGGTGL